MTKVTLVFSSFFTGMEDVQFDGLQGHKGWVGLRLPTVLLASIIMDESFMQKLIVFDILKH